MNKIVLTSQEDLGKLPSMNRSRWKTTYLDLTGNREINSPYVVGAIQVSGPNQEAADRLANYVILACSEYEQNHPDATKEVNLQHTSFGFRLRHTPSNELPVGGGNTFCEYLDILFEQTGDYRPSNRIAAIRVEGDTQKHAYYLADELVRAVKHYGKYITDMKHNYVEPINGQKLKQKYPFFTDLLGHLNAVLHQASKSSVISFKNIPSIIYEDMYSLFAPIDVDVLDPTKMNLSAISPENAIIHYVHSIFNNYYSDNGAKTIDLTFDRTNLMFGLSIRPEVKEDGKLVFKFPEGTRMGGGGVSLGYNPDKLGEPMEVLLKEHKELGCVLVLDEVWENGVKKAELIQKAVEFYTKHKHTINEYAADDTTFAFRDVFDPINEELMEKVKKYPHYYKNVEHLKVIDIYRVLDLYQVTDPCLSHAAKKILCAGHRGVKDQEKDIREAIDTLQRGLQIIAENANKKES